MKLCTSKAVTLIKMINDGIEIPDAILDYLCSNNKLPLDKTTATTDDILYNILDLHSFSLFKFVKNPSENLCHRLIKYNGLNSFRLIKNPTVEMCKMAIAKNSCNIENMVQTNELCKAAIDKSVEALQFIRDQTEELCIYALKRHIDALTYMRDVSESVYETATAMYGNDMYEMSILLNYMPKNYPSLINKALDMDIESFKCIKYQTPEMCDMAVRRNPALIEYAIYQNKSMCNLAFDYDINLFKYLHVITVEMLCKVCETDFTLLKYAKKYIAKDSVTAKVLISNYPKSIRYIKADQLELTEKDLINVVTSDGKLLKYVPCDKCTMPIIMAAVESNPKAAKYIPNSMLTEENIAFISKYNAKTIKHIPQHWDPSFDDVGDNAGCMSNCMMEDIRALNRINHGPNWDNE